MVQLVPGKSVFHVYDILADVAYNNSFVFIIDSQTSGEILARVLAFNSKSTVSILSHHINIPIHFQEKLMKKELKLLQV